MSDDCLSPHIEYGRNYENVARPSAVRVFFTRVRRNGKRPLDYFQSSTRPLFLRTRPGNVRTCRFFRYREGSSVFIDPPVNSFDLIGNNRKT